MLPSSKVSADLVSVLRDGNPLSGEQVELLKSQPNDSKLWADVQETFVRNTRNVLTSLSLSVDEQSAQSENQPSSLASWALHFLTPQIVNDAAAMCKEQINAESPRVAFFLTLYSNICIKYTSCAADAVHTLLPILAHEDDSIPHNALLTLIILARSDKSIIDAISKCLRTLLETEGAQMTKESFRVLCIALETFIPIFPTSMVPIYVSDACKNAFLYRGLLLNPDKDVEDYTTAELLLQVVASSCIVEDARKFNTQNYLQLLVAGTRFEGSSTICSLSLVCVIKLWNFSAIEKQLSLESVLSKVVTLFKASGSTSPECKYLLEAMAYLSLGGATRVSLREDPDILEHLLLVLETSTEQSGIYGCLLVFSNLTKLKSGGEDGDTTTLNYLKSIATPQGNSKEDEESIILFNESMVHRLKLVDSLSALKTPNENAQTQIVTIVYHLSCRQNHTIQRAIVSQGGLNIILKFLIDHSKVKKETQITTGVVTDTAANETRLKALRSLATMCRSVDPSLAFNKFSVKSSVPFLVELLGGGYADANQTELIDSSLLDPSDTLCALLGLTSIASKHNPDLDSFIVHMTFDRNIKNLLIDNSIPAIQKAAWELVNNLMDCPYMLAKFFNPDSADSRRNLDLLVKLLHSTDESLQVVIAGLLANSTMESEIISISLMSQNEIFDQLCKIIVDILQYQAQHEDLTLRVVTFLLNLLLVAMERSPVVVKKLDSSLELKKGLKNVIATTKNPEIITVIREIITTVGLKI